MSDMPIEDQNSLKKLGSVLLAKLSKDALRTLSLAHDCGYLDTIMDKEVNPQVAIDFPEDFVNPYSVGDDIDDTGIGAAEQQDESPYDYDGDGEGMVECTEVIQVEVLTKVWKAVE